MRREAVDASCCPAAALAECAQSRRVGADSPRYPDRRSFAAAAGGVRADPTIRRVLHRAVGTARTEVRPRRSARCPVLNWRYIEPPHVRYSVVALRRQGELHGCAVCRHRHEPFGRVTLLVDFLVDPDDIAGLKTLLRWVDRAARAEDADKIRCHVMNGAFRRVLRRNGYFTVKSTLEVSVKVNAVQVPKGFYDDTDGWHITLATRIRIIDTEWDSPKRSTPASRRP